MILLMKLKLSKASVTSYLPYRKGVYFPSTAEKGKISVGAERQRRYRAMKRWKADPTEENFWGVVLAYAGVKFKTYSGLPFSYESQFGYSKAASLLSRIVQQCAGNLSQQLRCYFSGSLNSH